MLPDAIEVPPPNLPDRAPDLETVLDIDSAIEGAVQILVAAEDIDQVAVSRGVGTLNSKRVDVLLSLGQTTGSLYVPRNLPEESTNTDELFEQAWKARLSLRIVTERDENGEFHALYRARVRSVMLRFASLFTREVLPYHVLTQVRTAGTHTGLITDKNEDYSELLYDCLVCIRRDAWPDPY